MTAPIAANTYTITYGAPTTYSITATLGGQTVTGTVAGGPTGPISSTEAAGNSNVVINAALGLNNGQSIVFNGINNVLNAEYSVGVGLSSLTNSNFPASNFVQSGLNIQGVQTWNIDAYGGYAGYSSTNPYGAISFTGDGTANHIITGLTTVNFNDNSGSTSLLIGDNAEPVDSTTPADGFAINVSNAIGNGYNGVDVDIAAQEFTGKDTINVGADIVGGFPESNGSYVWPSAPSGYAPYELGSFEVYKTNDGDTYNPNWTGFERDAFAISAGASAGPNGSIGFQNWVISSTGAKSVGSMNIIALGGEGSTTAQTITLTDDGSPTMLFASAISDSMSTDWENVTTINLTGTSGNVVLTGAEVDAQAGGWTSLGGGLLTSDTTALETITGGAGNSFYDLSSLTLAGIQAFKGAESYDGGHGTGANSEIAFNNYVVANASATNVGTTVNISHIQVLDDTGGLVLSNGTVTDDQGGVINMADFAELAPLNTNYDLLSGPLGNLFYVKGGSVLQDPTFAASTDVAPAGYQLLQLLNSDGSTANVLGANLSILDGFTQFAINMMDVADGTITTPTYNGYTDFGYNGFGDFTQTYGQSQIQHGVGDYFISDGPIYVDPSLGAWALYTAPLTTLTGYDITIVQESPVPLVNAQSHLKLWLADDGVNVYSYNYSRNGGATSTLVGTIFDASAVTIDNYTTADIYLPYESVTGTQNWVVLGSQDPTAANGYVGGFVDQPVVSVPLINGTSASVNFYDNTVDTGGSPPGGPDNLVLGVTNFTTDLAPTTVEAYWDPQGSIGYATVIMDATSPTTINDFGHGSLEIGATNATNLNAQSTSHLIMDLPGVPQYVGTDGLGAAHGITVNGSLLGQNLLQGSSGIVTFDTNGHIAPANSVSTSGNGSGVLEGMYPFQDYLIGNDTLTGGVGSGVNNAYYGETTNTGDNYFPEGGLDTVNEAHAATNTAYDTVWVGMFDVSSVITSAGVAPHYVFGQAVTDIVGGVETYVDGYGPGVGLSVGTQGPSGSTTSLLTINGFLEGNTATTGDILNFDPQDWATSAYATNVTVDGYHNLTDYGLVDAYTGNTITTTNHAAILSHVTYVGTSASAGEIINQSTTVIEDGIAGYQNAAQLVKALTTADEGDIGGLTFKANSVEHVLIAYNNTVTGGVTIDDVTFVNTTGSTITDTAHSGLIVTAVDMVNIIGTAANPATVGNLSPHNIEFLHG